VPQLIDRERHLIEQEINEFYQAEDHAAKIGKKRSSTDELEEPDEKKLKIVQAG
jgi:hypothetical protein